MNVAVLPRTRLVLPGCKPAVLGDAIGPENRSMLRVECPECRRTFKRDLTPKEREDVIALYRNGGFHPDGHVQDVFPTWSADDRELFLQSHLCGACWKKLFGEPDMVPM